MYRSDDYSAGDISHWHSNDTNLSEPRLIENRPGPVARWATPVISLAVLVVAVSSLRGLNIDAVTALIPRQPAFWLIFALSYFAAPIADWVIFRQLWRIPASGVLPLVRKFIGNELLLGYVGEVYFYAWMRQRTDINAAPFGAIKDVAILSALVGNLVTLVLIAAAAPFYAMLGLGTLGTGIVLSIGIVLLTSCAALGFRKRLFTLPRAELHAVAGFHLARILTIMALTATMWHLALPAVAMSWWLLLATMRMLLSRLPFMPNKDLVFAGIAVVLVGRHIELATLMTMMASLILATHVLLGVLLASHELLESRLGE